MDKILIVDENPTDRKLLQDVLSGPETAYHVTGVDNAPRAFKEVDTSPPDLILVGLTAMGNEDIALLKQIEGRVKNNIPILLVSYFSQEIDKVKGLESGAMDIIDKPIIPQEVKVRVAVQLKIKRLIEDARWVERETNKGIKLLYRELEKKNEDLKKLDDLKSQFVSTVSHELRTPLTMMQEFSEIILDEIPGKLNDDQKKYMGIIHHNIERLTRLINDLLNISRIESGQVELKKQRMNMADVVSGVLTIFKVQTDKRGMELRAVFQDPSLTLYVDPDRIVEVFINLVGNAVKFTPDGGTIMIEVVDKASHVECVVSDSGRGIPPEHLGRIFDRFYQVDRAAGPEAKGTGLGLAISHDLIRMHGGKLWVESEVGKGTKFIFMLPKEALTTSWPEAGQENIL
jgi:signal transduction histidine kinase